MMKFRHAIAVLALGAMMGTGCSCDPVVPKPDGGMGGGSGGGTTGGGTGGGAMGGGAGGGGGATGGGGGAIGGGAGGGGGAAQVQFTEYVRNLIVTGTNGTTQAAPPAAFQALPDDAPITYSQGFFDGGTN